MKKVSISIPDKLLIAIDYYQAENNMPTRSEALRRLLTDQIKGIQINIDFRNKLQTKSNFQ